MANPNPLDHYRPDGTLDAAGWAGAVIDHARAQHEPTEDADDLADTVAHVSEMNTRLGAENVALLDENTRLRRALAPAVQVGPTKAEHAAEMRRHRVRAAVSGHLARKQAQHAR